MTKQPQTDGPSGHVSAETERALRDYVRAAVSRLSEAPNIPAPEWEAGSTDQTPMWEADSGWERGTDGHFRKYAKRPRRWLLISNEWLRSVSEYDTCVEQLRCDPVVGPQLDRMVGTNLSASSLEADGILLSLIHGMLEGNLAYTDERFEREWRELADFLGADRIAVKMVAPLPHLVLPAFPLRLSDELVLDRLTDDEVTRCCQVSVLRPDSPRFPLIIAEDAVGVRRTMFLPKLIRTIGEAREPREVRDEGSFGRRSPGQDALVVDDVLSALRLFKKTQIRAAGYAAWTDSPLVNTGTLSRVLGQWPYGGQFALSEGEVPQFLELWRLLEEGGARFGFSIRRFSLAFDRGLAFDRIVDLVISAESLFLGDHGVQDRGELRFRFALRAAKFIEHPVYGERDVYRVMRRAYDVRSTIVHGGSPEDTRLPDDQHAKVPAFIDSIEEIVRLGLRKGLSMKHDAQELRKAEYWEDLLLLSTPNQSLAPGA